MTNNEIKKIFERDEYTHNSKEYQIKLINESDTLGNIMAYEIKNNENIINCGYKRDIMLNTITLKIYADSNKKVLKGIDEAVKIFINKISHFGATIIKLREKIYKDKYDDSECESDEVIESDVEKKK